MDIKHHISQLQDIKAGDIKDNAQYIYLFFENSNRKSKELFTCKLKDGTEYTGRLFGRSETVDADGNEVIDCKVYLEYLNKNKNNLLHNSRLAGIELVDKYNRTFNTFTSMHDCFDYLQKKELEN